MKRKKVTFEIEYNEFEKGELITPSSERCPLGPGGVFTVTEFIPPSSPGDEATVFVEGHRYGMSACYWTEAPPAPTNQQVFAEAPPAPTNQQVFAEAPKGAAFILGGLVYRKVLAALVVNGIFCGTIWQLLSETSWAVTTLDCLCRPDDVAAKGGLVRLNKS